MSKRVIVEFCKLNVSLLRESRNLLFEAETIEKEYSDVLHIRCIRCLAQCFTCGSTAYVRVSGEIFTAPDPGELKEFILKVIGEVKQNSAEYQS